MTSTKVEQAIYEINEVLKRHDIRLSASEGAFYDGYEELTVDDETKDGRIAYHIERLRIANARRLRATQTVERVQAARLEADEMIMCAAVRLGSLTLSVPRPGRHHTIINGWFDVVGRSLHDFDSGAKAQGFLTTKGRFVDRKEAWPLAERAGQIVRRCGGDGPEGAGLFSENLW